MAPEGVSGAEGAVRFKEVVVPGFGVVGLSPDAALRQAIRRAWRALRGFGWFGEALCKGSGGLGRL